jgi:hypothetical protein
MFALAAQHGALIMLRNSPYRRLVLFQSVVTAYTSVELRAARVANCDDIACGVPVFALGQCRDGYAIDLD